MLIHQRIMPVWQGKGWLHLSLTRNLSQHHLLHLGSLRACRSYHQLVCVHPEVPHLSSQLISGDSRGYPPSPPFEEAGPTSSVWRAYLHESLIDDSDTLRNQRGEVNILLVFMSNFSLICITSLNCILFWRPDCSQQLWATSLRHHQMTFSQTIKKYLLFYCSTRSLFNSR